MTATHTPNPTPTVPSATDSVRGLGTDVLFALDAPASDPGTTDAFALARAELDRLERVFSRFDEHSELRTLERTRIMRVSDELWTVVTMALDARRRSGGRFDPTILPSLRALGYDRSIEHVREHVRGGAIRAHEPGRIALDAATRTIALPPGVALDLGGIAKGWIADRLAALLATVAPALVDAGGDISCTPRRDDAPWTVAVDGLARDTFLELPAGGIATSGVDRRRWTGPTGDDRHHAIDPSTGASAATDLARVTVLARSCAAAEVAATSMLVGGSASLEPLAASFDVAWIAAPLDPAAPVRRSRELA